MTKKPIKLVFNQLNSQFSHGLICSIKGFGGSNYSIWKDLDKGRVIVSGLDRQRTEHDSVDAAMKWCQSDFESRLNGLFEVE